MVNAQASGLRGPRAWRVAGAVRGRRAGDAELVRARLRQHGAAAMESGGADKLDRTFRVTCCVARGGDASCACHTHG